MQELNLQKKCVEPAFHCERECSWRFTLLPVKHQSHQVQHQLAELADLQNMLRLIDAPLDASSISCPRTAFIVKEM